MSNLKWGKFTVWLLGLVPLFFIIRLADLEGSKLVWFCVALVFYSLLACAEGYLDRMIDERK